MSVLGDVGRDHATLVTQNAPRWVEGGCPAVATDHGKKIFWGWLVAADRAEVVRHRRAGASGRAYRPAP